MTKKEVQRMSIEQLVFGLVCRANNTTKKSQKEEVAIIKELSNRGIISYDEMKSLYEKSLYW